MQSVHAKNAICVAIALVLAAPFGTLACSSAALGGLIQLANLWLMHRSVGRMLEGSASGGLQAVLMLRLMGLLGLVGAVLLTVPVEPVWFCIGLSTAVPASLWHGFVSLRRREQRA